MDTGIAFSLAAIGTALAATWMKTSQKRSEDKAPESAPQHTENALRLNARYIRQDIAAILMVLTITNGLLAAILVTILSHHS